MYGEDYAWVISGSPQDSWWQDTAGTNCSASQLVQAVQGVVLVAAHGSLIGAQASQAGLVRVERGKLCVPAGPLYLGSSYSTWPPVDLSHLISWPIIRPTWSPNLVITVPSSVCLPPLLAPVSLLPIASSWLSSLLPLQYCILPSPFGW